MQHPKVSSLFIHMFISGEETKLLQENHSFDNSCRELRWLNDTTDEVLLGPTASSCRTDRTCASLPRKTNSQKSKKNNLCHGKRKHKLKASSCVTDAGMRMVSQQEYQLRSTLTFLTRTISIFVLSWGECCSIRGKTRLQYDKVLFQSNSATNHV